MTRFQPMGWQSRLLVASIAVASLATTIACRGSASVDPAARDATAATKETETWRAMHEESYRRNWATIAGLHFLDSGTHTAGTAPGNDIVLPASASSPRIGRFVLSGEVVRFEPDAAAQVHIGDRAITTPID